MATNTPKGALHTLTIPDVDVFLLEAQLRYLEDLAQGSKVSPAERRALSGVLSMLKALDPSCEGGKKTLKKLKQENVNRVRDLAKAGKSSGSIAEQFEVSEATIQSVLDGVTYKDWPYKPSEFALKK